MSKGTTQRLAAPDPHAAPAKAAQSNAALVADRLVVGGPGAAAVGPVSLRLAAGAGLCLCGPSGAGKSTLLRVLALTERPRAGTLTLWGEEAGSAADTTRARLRRQRLATAHQQGNLVSALDVAANVTLQATLAGQTCDEDRLRRALAAVELEALAARPAHVLSVGEAARAAVARLLYQAPGLALADEPTAALDPHRAALVATALQGLREAGSCLVVATHDPALVERLGGRVDAALFGGAGSVPGTSLRLGGAGLWGAS